MARGLTSAVKTELATGNINPVHLIHLNFSTPVYLTDCSFPLTSSISGSSQTYLANRWAKMVIYSFLSIKNKIRLRTDPSVYYKTTITKRRFHYYVPQLFKCSRK